MPLTALDVPPVACQAELLLAAGEVPHPHTVVVRGRDELEVRGAEAEGGRGGQRSRNKKRRKNKE